jgi:membrane associated rhomboid family serine protease
LRSDKLQPFDFISYQFLHGDLMHLLGNMFFLIVCGFAVEAAIGHWRFLLFYLLAGVGGGAAQVLMHMDSITPLVGASGSISGVMAMYLAAFRFKKIEFFYWLFFLVGYFRAPALMILPFYVGKEIFSYFQDKDSNVAFMAHTGGFIAGALLIGLAWVFNRKVFNTDYIDNDQAGDPQQQKMAEVYKAIEQFQFERALKLVDNLIASQGHTFDLALIRYNLLRLNRGEAFEKAAIGLLCLPSLMPAELKKLDKIWRDNPELHNALEEQQLLKLGVQFASHASAESAEKIYRELQQRGCKDSSMAVFATKLAKAYHLLNDHAKKNRFEQLANEAAR